jgi:hypothetical protein
VLVVHLKRFQQIAKKHLISFSHGFKKLDDYVTFPEYLDLTPFLVPRKEDYRLGKRRKDRVDGGRGRRGVCIGCMLFWSTLGIWCVPFFLFLGSTWANGVL